MTKQDGYGIQKDEETSIDSLADYWRNHGSNVKADEIDMTSLIFDALEKENSVVDITEHIEKIIDGEVWRALRWFSGPMMRLWFLQYNILILDKLAWDSNRKVHSFCEQMQRELSLQIHYFPLSLPLSQSF